MKCLREGPWKVEKIPVLQDNFVFVLHDENEALVIDPGQSEPVLRFLDRNRLKCQMILITHHHSDHIHGLMDIKSRFSCRVYAPRKNKRQLHFGVTDFISENEIIHFKNLQIQALPLPGHTLGHMGYWISRQNWLFSGDVIFALGCGRVFEGSFEQMFNSLQKIKSLPEDSLIFCTHDYFESNASFCKEEGFPITGYVPHLPLELKQELVFNPFLKAPDLESFQILREKRNSVRFVGRLPETRPL